MKKLLLAATLSLLPASAFAQCNGIFQPNTICGKQSVAGPPGPIPTSVLTGIPGGTPGQIQYNNAGTTFGGFTASGDVAINTGTGVATIQPNAIITSKIAANAVTNARLATGAANTVKGSIDGATTSDLAISTCSAIYNTLQWISGTGWSCGINPVLSSRTVAATLNLSAYSVITTQGYTTGGDGGGATFTKVGSQPFCGPYSNTASFQDIGGNWWNIAEPLEFNIRQFGAKQDSIFGVSGTDDTAAVLSSFRCAAVMTGAGDDVGGGAGKVVRVPAGWSLISSVVTVPNQVPVIGECPICNGFDMATGFATNTHFFILGDQFTQTDVAASQSRGSSGNLTLNSASQWYRTGTIYLLHPQVPTLYSASNNSGVNFTFTGTDRFGSVQTDTIAGPTAGSFASSIKLWSTITQVASSAATVGNVSVGFSQIATFGTRLQDLQLFATLDNAVQFSTPVNNSNTLIAGALGTAMIYSNSVQHTAGLKNVKVFAGNRSAVMFEIGVGGASTVTFQDVETFHHGNAAGVASNNPGIYIGYLGLQFPVSNLIVVSCGAPCGGTAIGIYVLGGFVNAVNIHCEGIATCIVSDIHNVNNGWLKADSVIGGNSMTDLIKIGVGSPANINYFSGLAPNGATNTVNNQGVLVTGNVIPWTLY